MACIPYPGAVRHDLNRGDRRKAIFAADQDRRRFPETLERPSKGGPRKDASGLGMVKPDDEALE